LGFPVFSLAAYVQCGQTASLMSLNVVKRPL